MIKTPRWRRVVTVMSSLAAAALLAGCAGQADGRGAGDSSSITLAVPQEPRTMASWIAYGKNGIPVMRNIEEALLNRNPQTGELVGELATSWEQLEPTVWQFTLRDGVTFHDGSVFDAEAAAYSLNYTLSEENAFEIRTFLGPDVTVEPVGDLTINVITDAPDPILPERMYFVPIVSAQLLQETPEKYETEPVGTGPYKFVTWNRGQSIELEANEDWWGRNDPEAALGDNSQITKATFVFRAEGQVAAGMVQTGEADFAANLTADQCGPLPKCESGTGVETFILRIDTPNPLLADPRIREAIALSFSKEQLIENIIGGGEASGQLPPPTANGYDDSLMPYPVDAERAKALVAEAQADGAPIGEELTIVAAQGMHPRISEVVEYIADSMRTIGLSARSEVLERSKYSEQVTSGYDNITPERGLLSIHSHGNELLDASLSFGGYFTCDRPTAAYCSPEMDERIAAASELTGEERKEALQSIAQFVHENYLVVPIGRPNENYGMAEYVEWEPRTDGFLLVKEMRLEG